ncbi:MAG TPA: carbohydrate ABC transporter permease [Symbiobacteriaceae bacterium]|nr:carbohydrate ABC transporter permease [Symbiobacteriaceae bacterium]
MKRRKSQLLSWIGLIIGAAILLLPVIFALSRSLMTSGEAMASASLIPEGLRWENFGVVIRSNPVFRYLLNSLIVASLVTLGAISTSALAAYALVFTEWRGKAIIFAVILSTLMVPWEVTLIPNFLLIRSLKLTDTYAGMILPFVASAFGIFLLRQFFAQIPRDLWDAARIDGAGHVRFLFRVVLPLGAPGLLTLGFYTFLSAYNMYLWPLLTTNTPTMRTVQVGVRFLMNEESRQYPLIMAGVIIFLLPAMALLLWGNRYLVRGLMAGAVKG